MNNNCRIYCQKVDNAIKLWFMQNFTRSSGKRPCPQPLPQFTFSWRIDCSNIVSGRLHLLLFCIIRLCWQVHSETFISQCKRRSKLYFKPLLTKIAFTCDRHSEWGFRFSLKIIIKVFYNNKQKFAADAARKEAVVDFKKWQRKNNICFMLFLCYLYILLGVYFAI